MDKDIFEGIKAGLEDALAFTKGDHSRGQIVHAIGHVDVKAVRKKTGLTQAQFCETYFIPLPTLKNWECGTRTPEGPSRAYLLAIGNAPQAIKSALEKDFIPVE